MRHEGRRDGNRERFPGDSRNERGERMPRGGERPAANHGAKRPPKGGNRHAPQARNTGFADERNVAGGERGPNPDNRNNGKPAAGKKRWHGGNRSEGRNGQGGERRAQSGNRRG